MKRPLILAALGSAVVVGMLPTVSLHAMTEGVVPATAGQIMRALGPDAEGLRIPSEKIPDIFTLTASRLDEDKTRFVIQEPYKAGRWKGGKVIIEYARDLSYTQVSVYDKSGHRERIYSVVNRPAGESDDEDADQSSPPESTSSTGWQPISSAPSEESTHADTAQRSGSSAKSTTARMRRHRKKTSFAVTTVRTPAPGSLTTAAVVGFQWDDARGTYVQIHADGAASIPISTPQSFMSDPQNPSDVTPSPEPSRSKHHPKTTQRELRPSTPVVADVSTLVHTSSKSHGRKKTDSESSVPTDQATTVHPAPDGNTSDASLPSETSPVTGDASGSHSGSRSKSKKSIPTETAETPVDLHPSPREDSGNNNSTTSPSHVRDAVVQPAQYVWSDKAGTYVSAASASGSSDATETPTVPSTKHRGRKRTSNDAAPIETADIPSSQRGSGASSPALNPEPPEPLRSYNTESSMTSKNRSVANPSTARRSNNDNGEPSVTSHNADSNSSVDSDSDFTLRSQPGGPVPSTEDLLASGPSGAHSDSPRSKEPAVSSSHKKTVAPPAEIPPEVAAAAASLDAQAKPDTSGADRWSPKKVAAPAPLPETAAAPKVIQIAMVPKPAAPDSSIESLLKIGQAGKTAKPNEADTWSPKAETANPMANEVELNAALAQARKEENKPVAVPVIKIKRDVNNPEQGVLPANSFEKFAGPRYGRHWEYERRLHLEKRTEAPVKDYDFFVDEVDRKKEIHNVYYYKHLAGQTIPKLLAVERHANVTFMSNYDVGGEDKGKTSKYD